jgi:hypothetical protein
LGSFFFVVSWDKVHSLIDWAWAWASKLSQLADLPVGFDQWKEMLGDLYSYNFSWEEEG